MKKTFLALVLSTFTLTSLAQTPQEDQRAISTYISRNFVVPIKAMSFYDMPERLDDAVIMLSIELTPAGGVNMVNVSNGIDELFDNALRTFVYLIPKGTCAPAADGQKRLANVMVGAKLEPMPTDVARLLEMRSKRRRFSRIKIDDELRRQVPEVLPYLDKPGTSLWIMRSRAYQLTMTPLVSEQ